MFNFEINHCIAHCIVFEQALSAMASNFWGRIVIGTNKSYKIFLTPVSEFMSEEDGVIVRDTVMGTTDLTK